MSAPEISRRLPPGFFRSAPGRPVIIGHRGVRREGVDENTLPAFEAALAEGAEAIELDVRLASTGEIVVAHDLDLARVAGTEDKTPVAGLSWATLKARTLLHGGRVPLLTEVLDLARARHAGVNVEMKHDVPDRLSLVRAVARLLGSWDPKLPLLVSSFHPAMLVALRGLCPRLPLAILLHRNKWRMHGVGSLASSFLGGEAVHLERTLTRPELVRAIKARGQLVNVWTVNDPREAQDLAALGVDGLITDDPGAIRAALSPS